MNTNYDDEATRYQDTDNEGTQYEESPTTEQDNNDNRPVDEVEVKSVKKSGWRRATAGAASGLIIGSAATVLMGMKSADTDTTEDDSQEDDNHRDTLSNPEWVDDDIQVATTVSDDMSFNEAFATARAEVGPGGCFEWHGNVYATYTAEEWNGMTAEQRADYNDHFSWNHTGHSSHNVAQHSTTANHNHTAQAYTSTDADDEIEIVSVNHGDDSDRVAPQDPLSESPDDIQGLQTVSTDTEPEVMVLGVTHDDESGANIGAIGVDGQQVILIDVDGNMEFDYMASDLNGNGQYDENEVVDIADGRITVNDLGGFTDATDNMLATNDTDDFSSDNYDI